MHSSSLEHVLLDLADYLEFGLFQGHVNEALTNACLGIFTTFPLFVILRFEFRFDISFALILLVLEAPYRSSILRTRSGLSRS